MYFRLYNSSGTFQRMMNSIFRELLHKEKKHNLCFKQSKCDFDMEEILILGVVVAQGEV